MTNLSIIISMILSVIPFVIAVVAFCVVESKTKSKLKAFIAFAIVVAITAFVRVYVVDNINTHESNNETTVEEEDSEPNYLAFNDIEILLNPESAIYYEVNEASDLSFEYEDDDGNIVDWTDDEKQNFWNDITSNNSFDNYLVLQSFFYDDIIVLIAQDMNDIVYDNIDTLVDDMIASSDDVIDKEDYTIDGVHACTVYRSYDDGSSRDFSETVFIYDNTFYGITVISLINDIDTIMNESVKTIKLL